MPCWIRRLFRVIKNFYEDNLKYLIVYLLISISCLITWPSSLQAKVEFFDSSEGVPIQRSLESLRDLDDQNWQIIAYSNEGNQGNVVLRIVGFTGSLRLDHPTKLHMESGLKICNLEDITLKNPELSNDNESILERIPRTDSSGVIPLDVNPVILVLTNPGCKIATAIPCGFRSIDKDLPAIQSATLDIRYP